MVVQKVKKLSCDAGSRAALPNSSGCGENGKKERYFTIFVIIILLIFGFYHSVLYFGHTIVPNSDFPAFTALGHELWSLKMPSSFKRGPVLGLLQVPIGWLVDGPYPDLTAGWLLNTLLHPFNVILLWLIGKKILGKSGVLFAVLAILNPWAMYLLTEPIAETTFLFFILLTVYLIFEGSRWRYIFAAVTTMVRYEGAALILAAFVTDMIYATDRRMRIRAFLYSATAFVPLGIWMLGTFMSRGTSSNYLSIFGKNSYYSKLLSEPYESQMGFALHMKLLWQGAFKPLLQVIPNAGEGAVQMIWSLSKAGALIAFLFGGIYGLFRRQWKILGLLLFFLPYFLIHSMFPAPLLRYYAPVFWITLLISWYGLQSCWELINARGLAPKSLVLVLQAGTTMAAVIWLVALLPYLPKISQISPRSVTVPYVAMVITGLIIAVRLFVYRFGHVLRELSILAVMCLIIISNQFSLVSVVGDGQRDKEFKLLAQWYAQNTKPGEKMGIYMFGVVRIFVHEHRRCCGRLKPKMLLNLLRPAGNKE